MRQTPIHGKDPARHDPVAAGAVPCDPLAAANAELARELDNVRAHERALLFELAGAARDAQEKDFLLREADHRLKNVLQLACSMLQSQARDAQGKDAPGELEAASSRLKAVAEMQVGLHDTGGMVQLDQWLPRICRSMVFRPSVELDVRVPPLSWPSSVASPLGLFACEAVCNAMKHAFADHEHGRVLVQMLRQDDDWRLSIADDGRGGPGKAEPNFGMRLLTMLAHQLRGRLDITRGLYGRGLGVSVLFPAPRDAAVPPDPKHA